MPHSLPKKFSSAAKSYDAAAVLARETGQRMAERLDYVKIAPRRFVDIGCATGDGALALQRRYPSAVPLAVDFAIPMLQQLRLRTPRLQRWLKQSPHLINANANRLPLATASIGLVWSNLMLQWLDDPLPAFQEMHRVLEVGGLLMFASLGPDTLKDLRSAASSVGAGDTVRRFPDMHDLGDMLVATGFSDPVMDMEMLTLTYPSPRGFLADQRQLGVRNGLLGQQDWRAWRRIFAGWERNEDGLFPARFEIVYGHAWKMSASQPPRTTAEGHAIMTFHPPGTRP